MNDHTPRRFKGSLLERAAPSFHYAPAPIEDAPAAPAAPAAPVAKPAQKRVEAPVAQPETAPAPVPAPEPLTAPEPMVAPVEPVLARGVPVEPEPQIATARPTGRRMAPLDRAVLEQGGMLMPGAAIGPLAEEFRMVKRQLLLTARAVAAKDTAKAADRARMILVCSAQPSEGKTFCAINLALSMATEKDVEVLLVDADFPKPDVLPRLGLPSGPGLLDVLAGSVSNVEDCIIDTDVPQLSVLPAGARSNSDTELLASDRARAVIDGLAAANPRRIVIFDSPPALAASPASVLALHVGQVMLVVRADKTSEGDLRAAVNTLDACEHIQLVLNSVSFQPGGRRFGSYYEYGEEGR
ncbi:AAA family ATPase [Sphingomonas sp. KR3-1]|uniref:AAA family ATPase n=1 Tax=Sphingomonas sp. KR3-1 TaxID=3156611 RepID=UPI0032B58BB5